MFLSQRYLVLFHRAPFDAVTGNDMYMVQTYVCEQQSERKRCVCVRARVSVLGKQDRTDPGSLFGGKVVVEGVVYPPETSYCGGGADLYLWGVQANSKSRASGEINKYI